MHHAIDTLIEKLKLQHKSWNTIKTYRDWSNRYATWLNSHRHLAKETSEAKVEAYLTGLAKDRVSASTQNQAFHALIAFYKLGLNRPLAETVNALRAQRPQRIRTAPDLAVITQLLQLVTDHGGYPTRLLIHLLYACGLRVSEGCHLRIRDINLTHHTLLLREAKGNKDRLVVYPPALTPAIERQIRRARLTFEADLEARIPINLPHQLAKKYPAFTRAWEWAWLVPQHDPCHHPITNELVRHHLHEANLQRTMRTANRAAGLTGITPHHLRHAYATHAHRAGVTLRDLQTHLGHSHLETTARYITPTPTPIPSPYEALNIQL